MSIDPARVQVLYEGPRRSASEADYVLLWMQQDVRAKANHALEVAIAEANCVHLPVLACYNLCECFPDATERSFRFLLEGLQDAAEQFAARGVRLVCKRSPPPEFVLELAVRAACVVVDCGYLRQQQEHVKRLGAGLRVLQVETSVVVPVRKASSMLEPATATLRPKIHSLLTRFLVPVRAVQLQFMAPELPLDANFDSQLLNLRKPDEILAGLDIDRSVPPSGNLFRGGTRHAEARLEVFLPKLRHYGTGKANDPSKQVTSFLSPYLRFGQISSLWIALRVREFAKKENSETVQKGMNAFLEELIIRRESARNFCFFCDQYDNYDCVPVWAKMSLEKHTTDPRSHLYSYEQLERGETHDPYWNAAQWELLSTGHIHNYLRMYWCKQLITWTPHPLTAFQWAVRLNDKFSIDGRDENGYISIAWCFGQHDRPFPENPIFGEVRSMTRSGIERKFDMDKYQQLVRRKCRDVVAAERRIASLLPESALQGPGGNRLLFSAFAKASSEQYTGLESSSASSPLVHEPLAAAPMSPTVGDNRCDVGKRLRDGARSTDFETPSKRLRFEESPDSGGFSNAFPGGASADRGEALRICPTEKPEVSAPRRGLHRFFKPSTQRYISGVGKPTLGLQGETHAIVVNE